MNIRSWSQYLRRTWAQRLDRLEAHLKALQSRRMEEKNDGRKRP